jgi:hypothetical protein
VSLIEQARGFMVAFAGKDAIAGRDLSEKGCQEHHRTCIDKHPSCIMA